MPKMFYNNQMWHPRSLATPQFIKRGSAKFGLELQLDEERWNSLRKMKQHTIKDRHSQDSLIICANPSRGELRLTHQQPGELRPCFSQLIFLKLKLKVAVCLHCWSKDNLKFFWCKFPLKEVTTFGLLNIKL